MTSLSGVTDARDQSLRVQPAWPVKKVLQTILASSGQAWANFRSNAKLSTVAYDLKQEKKAELYCDVNRKEIFVQICMSPIEIR